MLGVSRLVLVAGRAAGPSRGARLGQRRAGPGVSRQLGCGGEDVEEGERRGVNKVSSSGWATHCCFDPLLPPSYSPPHAGLAQASGGRDFVYAKQ